MNFQVNIISSRSNKLAGYRVRTGQINLPATGLEPGK
jgi:hypothetical protein